MSVRSQLGKGSAGILMLKDGMPCPARRLALLARTMFARTIPYETLVKGSLSLSTLRFCAVRTISTVFFGQKYTSMPGVMWQGHILAFICFVTACVMSFRAGVPELHQPWVAEPGYSHSPSLILLERTRRTLGHCHEG